MYSGQNVGRVVHGQGGLGDHGQEFRLSRVDQGDLRHIFHQVDALAQLSHGALDLRVTFVSNHDEFVAFFGQFGHLHMHFAHQWARGIKDAKASGQGFSFHRLGHTMGTEDEGRS